MRALAVFSASILVVASVFAALLMWFSAWFPYENLSSGELRKDDWLAPAGLAVLGLAVATLVFVVTRRPVWAACSFAAQAVIGVVALRFALRELSDNSDGKLIVFALSVVLVGTCAVIASLAAEARGT